MAFTIDESYVPQKRAPHERPNVLVRKRGVTAKGSWRIVPDDFAEILVRDGWEISSEDSEEETADH